MFRIPFVLATTATAAVLAAPMAISASQAAPTKATPAATPPKAIDARPWPREFDVEGVQFSLYRPQIDSWTGDQLQARAVLAVKTGETKDASGNTGATQDFGVLWFKARIETDKDAREAVLTNVIVERANFPTAKAKEAQYLALARKVAPTTAQVVSLDQLEADLAMTQAAKAAAASQPISNTPPEIIFSNKPAMLVLIDGQPILRASGVAGVEQVINTRAVVLKYMNVFYIGRDGAWAAAGTLDGRWTPLTKAPAPITEAATKIAAAQPGGRPPQETREAQKLPDIVVRTHAAELIPMEGDPAFADIPGTSLKYVSNTPADVFVDGQTWYVLVAGRWFSGPSTKGPWKSVAAKALPADFARIPGDNPKSAVLASIPGTPEAQESLIANSVPQTAAVDRKQARFQSKYDGAPQFKPIAGTSLTYAANSATPIIRAGDAFYALQNGVWFMASSAQGPWAAATSVPAEIYKIPSSSPLHYVTYAYVYGTNGDTIYVGYTPGYYGTVVHDSVVVYQTGYPCDAWVGTVWYGCPTPYGYGAAFGYGPAVGWALAFGWGWDDYWYDPWWGPWGYWPGYYYPAGAIAGNVYGRWGNSVVAGTAAGWANPWTGNYGRAGQGAYYNTRTGGRGYGYAGRNTNIYTGTSTAAAGGVRYNPETGRVVAGRGGSVSNIYTGDGMVGGSRVVANTETGRVTAETGVATRTSAGATAAGGFNSQGERVDAKGAGYVHYDRATGDVTKGGVVDVNGSIYAGHDGNVYKHTSDGWEQAGADGKFARADKVDSSLDRERAARDRGFDRSRDSMSGFERPGASRDVFQRNTYGAGFHGSMGGFRGAGIGMRRR